MLWLKSIFSLLMMFALSGCGGGGGSSNNVELLWVQDEDGDLYGDGKVVESIFMPDPYVLQENLLGKVIDCNDHSADVYHSANELVGYFDNNCDSFVQNIELLDSIAENFTTSGVFFDADKNKDISAQEVVSFLAMVNRYYHDVFPVTAIEDSIIWAFGALRNDQGGFFQNGIVDAPVRTSLYLFSVANACSIDTRLLPTCNALSSEMLESAKWVSNYDTPWSGNHDLAALLMLYKLFDLTQNSEYYEMYTLKRAQLIAGFVHTAPDLGYWPEAPESWSNRLLTVYMQTQLIFGGYYLILNPEDEEFRSLFVKESNLFARYADMNAGQIDVRDSYDFVDGESSEWSPLGQPSVPYHLCLQASIYCSIIADLEHQNLFYSLLLENFERDNQITLFSDAYLRFGVIEELRDLLILSGKLN